MLLYIQKNVSRFLFISIFCLLPLSTRSQEIYKIRILPFQYASGDPQLEYLENALPRLINNQLNISGIVNFSSTLVDSSIISMALPGHNLQDPGFGFQDHEFLKRMVKCDSFRFDYYVIGKIWEQQTIVYARTTVMRIDTTGTYDPEAIPKLREEFQIKISEPQQRSESAEPQSIAEAMAVRIAENFEIRFGKNIRIAILDFEMQGGDSLQYGFLENSLPTMLATGLSVSSRIKLIEISKQDKLFRQILTTNEAQGIYNFMTAIQYGRFLNANYLIMGEFWEMSQMIRLDIRCVNIESSEIVAIEGINIDEINTKRVPTAMNELAAKLRSLIELDFLEREKKPLSIAVVGVPPNPNTDENRDLIFRIINTMSKKLKCIPYIRAVENSQLIKKYLDDKRDHWEMSSELNADLLLILSLDRIDRDNFYLSRDIFDMHIPRQPILSSDVKRVDFYSLDTDLNNLFFELCNKIEIDDTSINKAALAEIKFQRPFNETCMGFRTGFLYGPWSRKTFLGSNIRLPVEYNFVWIPFSSPRVQLEPVILKLEFMGDEPEKKVIGLNYLLGVKYNFQPYSSRIPYLGGLFGILGAFRYTSKDYQLVSVPSFGITAGIKQSLSETGYIDVGLRWLYGFSEVAGTYVGDHQFAGSKMGGIQLIIGYSWYLH